jgi:2-hydroxychromene-2-carboxylate isomerase
MKHITFYFDVISPYAYLAFEQLPVALMGHSYSVTYKPIVFAALLKHHGQLGPAEIAPKRDWTYRQVLWQAREVGVDLQLPASHPFNPLALLRLAVATQDQGTPNRYVCETLFRHVWQGGAPADDAARLEALTAQLKPARQVQDATVKAQLKVHTD